jgi:Methionyl-tRNA formyltransferase
VQLVGVVASTRILRKNGWGWWDAVRLVRKTGLRYATYLWTVTTLYSLLRRLLVPDDPVRQHLREHRVPVHATRDINSSEGVTFVQNLQPDLLLSAHFNQLIGSVLLDLPSVGCLNIHPGALPQYKGVDPVIHALDRDEQRVGVTLHVQDTGFDTGAVLASAEAAVAAEDTLFSVTMRLFRRGTGLLLDCLAAHGAVLEGTPQEADAAYDSWPDSGLVGRLRSSGRRLIGVRLFWVCLRGNSLE